MYHVSAHGLDERAINVHYFLLLLLSNLVEISQGNLNKSEQVI